MAVTERLKCGGRGMEDLSVKGEPGVAGLTGKRSRVQPGKHEHGVRDPWV
jgi:hypothetical protein